MRLIWRFLSNTQSPRPSAPQLFEITVRFVTPDSAIAGIRFSGLPASPNPPDMIVMPSNNTPSNAAWGLGKVFRLIVASWLTGPACAAETGHPLIEAGTGRRLV